MGLKQTGTSLSQPRHSLEAVELILWFPRAGKPGVIATTGLSFSTQFLSNGLGQLLYLVTTSIFQPVRRRGKRSFLLFIGWA